MLGEWVFGAFLIFGRELVKVRCGGHLVSGTRGKGLLQSNGLIESGTDLGELQVSRCARSRRR